MIELSLSGAKEVAWCRVIGKALEDNQSKLRAAIAAQRIASPINSDERHINQGIDVALAAFDKEPE